MDRFMWRRITVKALLYSALTSFAFAVEPMGWTLPHLTGIDVPKW